MCGIVGMVTGARTGFWSDEIDAFQDMLFMDTLRGWDSTGVFGVSNKNNILIHKEASSGPNFIRTKEFDEFCRHAIGVGQIVVGHNRAATKGSVKDENAHPFWVNDNTILVQNGTYKGEHKHHADVEVDSHAIAHVMEKFQDDIPEALRHINAAYALVWYNVAKKTLYIIRNDERPMWISDTDKDCIMFASEPEFILVSASRNGLTLKYEPMLIKKHRLIEVTLDDTEGWKYKETELKDVDYDYKKGPYYKPANNQNSFSQPPHQRKPTVVENENVNNPFVTETGKLGTGDPAVDAFPLNPHKPTPFRVGNTTIQFNFFNFINRNIFDEYSLTKETADKVCDNWTNSRNRKHTIELEDYIKANVTHDCSTFYVWGRLCTEENTINSYVIFYTLIQNTTEEAVMDMVTNQRFYQTYNNNLIQCFAPNGKVVVVTNMLVHFEPIVLLDSEGKPLTHVH